MVAEKSHKEGYQKGSLQTIAALATAAAPAGIAVIRVSGSDTRRALSALFQSPKSPTRTPRRLIYGQIVDHKTNAPIDSALAVFMPGPNSYTGEDVVEFQLHGSLILVQRVLRSLYAFGIAPAEPGEFTKRAFLNGKLDLAQAEAISDLIHANSQEALRIASEQMSGKLSTAIAELAEPLRDSLAELEAGIDFPEEDIEPAKISALRVRIGEIRNTVKKFIASYSYGQVIREGFRVLLCGLPNAGKSTLLNSFLGTERAIVTDIPGTTRDLIEETATIQNKKFVFCDSAGITETTDTVEKIGVELAKGRLAWADVVLLVVDGSDKSDATKGAVRAVMELARQRASQVWMVVNKIDQNPNVIAHFVLESSEVHRIFFLSAKTGEGFEALRDALADEVTKRLPESAASSIVLTNERHRSCFVAAAQSLERLLEAMDAQLPAEILSAELRATLAALDEIVGRTWTEDILGRIFSKFCIGK